MSWSRTLGSVTAAAVNIVQAEVPKIHEMDAMEKKAELTCTTVDASGTVYRKSKLWGYSPFDEPLF